MTSELILTHATRLPYALIEITGPDAEKLLQGQTSINIPKLALHGVQYGTVNSPKGRMYGLFRMVRTEQGFLLRLREDCAETFLKQLGKYAAFFKCTLKRSEQLAAYGLRELPADLIAPESVDQCSVGAHSYLLQSLTEPALYELYTALPVHMQDNDFSAEDWAALETRSGIPELYPATLDQFILQHLNLHQLNAVSFDKGCYTGQEIIARMKFLGKEKKKTFLLHSTECQTAEPGASVFTALGEKCGELVRSHFSTGSGSVALAVLDIEFASSGASARLTSESGISFSVTELNYSPALPTDISS